MFACHNFFRVREDRRKISGYAEATIPFYLMDDFQRFFRLSRGTFEIILRNVATTLIPNIQKGRPIIKPEKKLFIAIWFIAHQDTIHRISDRFNMTNSSVIRCRNQVFDLVLQTLRNKFIYLPQNEDVKNKIIDDFHAVSQFPNVLGAIDGTHIRIVAPHDHPQIEKSFTQLFFRVFVQAICSFYMWSPVGQVACMMLGF